MMSGGGSLLSATLVAIGLSADCFAIALGAGMSNRDHMARQLLRVSASFGLVQTAMLVLGWFAGESAVQYIGGYDHWVAFGLLALVSGRMLWESFQSKGGGERQPSLTGGLSLLVVSMATSVDALAVGLSFAFLKVSIVVASLTVLMVTFLTTATGFLVGKSVGRFAGRWAEIVGAVVLLVIAFRVLLGHIL